MDPERAAAFADDLLDADKLKDLTAADGTLPGGDSAQLYDGMAQMCHDIKGVLSRRIVEQARRMCR